MKPDWKDAPEWANFCAMDHDKKWYWYENEPAAVRYQFFVETGLVQKCISGTVDWESTLEKRP